MTRAERHPRRDAARASSFGGYAVLAMLSLCLLFTGPAHVVLHGLEGDCHSHHAGHAGHAHGDGSEHARDASSAEEPAQIALTSENHSEESCVHCMQSGGQAPSVELSGAVIPGGALSSLALDHQVHREAHLGSPSPRGPPAVA